MPSNDLQSIEIKGFLPARDFAPSLRFYEAMGFSVDWSSGDLACLRHGDTRFLLQDFFVEAHAQWDKALNREYRELLAALPETERSTLREAQKAWLSFRDAETRLWWSEGISGGGTLQPAIVSSHELSLIRERVCQLGRYRQALSPWPTCSRRMDP